MNLVNILLGILSLVFLAYYYIQKKYSYWRERGVPFIKPQFPYGNFKGFATTKHPADAICEIYAELKGKFSYGGIYALIKPIAVITDLDLIKHILIKDFNYFTDHGAYVNEKDDPLSHNLFSMGGAEWKALRAKLSPTFTSGKMKMMFPTIAGIGMELKKCVDSAIEVNSELEIRDICGRFTTDVIATCAFGIDCNSLSDPKNIVREMGRRNFEEPELKGYKLFLIFAWESMARRLGIKITRDDVSQFFTKVLEDTIDYREENNIKRNDLMNLLLQLKNKGKLDDDVDEKADFLTRKEIVCQAFIFFNGGNETSSTTMSFAMNELVENQEIQEKLRDEINSVLGKHDGKITYEAVSEMKYLDQVIYETLRKYPIIPNLDRIANADYQVPDTKTVISKGQRVFIPIYAIQHDPEYYPDPEKFDPDRFTMEAVKSCNAMTFLTFGDGPRICIGQRFALIQSKIGLLTLILNYRWTKTAKTVYPVKYSMSNLAIILSPEGGVNIKAEKIQK